MTTRKSIYYWKSDRPFAEANTQNFNDNRVELEFLLINYIRDYFEDQQVEIEAAGGQGNHIAYIARSKSETYFVRIENGPENDNYMAVESAILQKVSSVGVKTPKVFHTDVTRKLVPFAVQIMEFITEKDLNHNDKYGELELVKLGYLIGQNIAKWQVIKPAKFGLFNVEVFVKEGKLEGYHDTYRDYFYLNLDIHLNYLVESGFLESSKMERIEKLIDEHDDLLDLPQGCLVHKDLALWNILGDEKEIRAFIDWDDAMSGNRMDDIALLACFQGGEFITAIFEGYSSI